MITRTAKQLARVADTFRRYQPTWTFQLRCQSAGEVKILSDFRFVRETGHRTKRTIECRVDGELRYFDADYPFHYDAVRFERDGEWQPCGVQPVAA